MYKAAGQLKAVLSVVQAKHLEHWGINMMSMQKTEKDHGGAADRPQHVL